MRLDVVSVVLQRGQFKDSGTAKRREAGLQINEPCFLISIHIEDIKKRRPSSRLLERGALLISVVIHFFLRPVTTFTIPQLVSKVAHKLFTKAFRTHEAPVTAREF